MKKTISGGARQAKRSLDSAVSSLLALISREYMYMFCICVRTCTSLLEQLYAYIHVHVYTCTYMYTAPHCTWCLVNLVVSWSPRSGFSTLCFFCEFLVCLFAYLCMWAWVSRFSTLGMFAPERAVAGSSLRSGWLCVLFVLVSPTGVLVCWWECGHWMCGESSLTRHSQFSRLGIQCHTPVYMYMMFVGSGLMRWVSFYSFWVFLCAICTCFSCTCMSRFLCYTCTCICMKKTISGGARQATV